jgi:glycosidase
LEKLDYIAELGASAIWLSPIFPSPTAHGYDATDYSTVEPRLGGEQALRELVAGAHGRGLRIILDLVCNHVSNRHPIFLEAVANPRSPYHDWFSFDDSDVGYRSFFGVRSMPQLKLANPEARAWMTDIGRYWLREFEVDGYRLDHANGPGPSYWSEFWAADHLLWDRGWFEPDRRQIESGRFGGQPGCHAVGRPAGRRPVHLLSGADPCPA